MVRRDSEALEWADPGSRARSRGLENLVPDVSIISRGVLADQVKERLLKDIVDGRYPPNARIVETSVARELGTSQAPVREALRGLEALGVVEIMPFKGARVRRPSAEQLLEAYAVRTELESLAARLAVPLLTDQALDVLLAFGEEMQRAADLEDGHAVAVADAGFHAEIVRLAHNRTLERVWRSLEPFSRTYLTLLVPGADVRWTADLHTPILAGLRERDPERVAAALAQHFVRAGERLGREWEEASSTLATSGRDGAAP